MKKIDTLAKTIGIGNVKDKMFETGIANRIGQSVKSRANYGIRPESKLQEVLKDNGSEFPEKLSLADRYKIIDAQRAYVLPK